MVSLGNKRYGNPIIVKSDGLYTHLKRLSFADKTFGEGRLQELIQQNPELLPVAEIEPAFAPLVSIGREVSTNAGPIDNLFLSPQGYLTIVETKLWRNPEARRMVVGQIIDYAKEVKGWSFDDLESRVRAYYKKFHGSELGIIDALRKVNQIDEDDESAIIDTISRNLQRGRFLLLVVGDGIRESVEAMAEFLQQTPQLHFTLVLVELQVYEIGEDKGTQLLVVPQIVTRTREITRAVVRVEGNAIESIHVEVDTKIESPKGGKRRTTLTEEDYRDTLSRHVDQKYVDFASKIIGDMENLEYIIDWKQGSYVVKLPDPGGSGQDFTLFVVTTDGVVYVGWLDEQLQRSGLPAQIALDFVRESADLFPNCKVSRKSPNSWEKAVPLKDLEQHYSEFVLLIEKLVDRIRQESKATT